MKVAGKNGVMWIASVAALLLAGLGGRVEAQSRTQILHVKAPSEVVAGTPFTVEVVPLYNSGTTVWWEPCTENPWTIPITVEVDGMPGSSTTVPISRMTIAYKGTTTSYVDRGSVQMTLPTAGWYRLKVTSSGNGTYTAATSYFPVKCVQNAPSERLYWGELHTHNSLDPDGWSNARDPNGAYAYGRYVGLVDFGTVVLHHWASNMSTSWPNVVAATNSNNVPGQFVAILGFECGSGLVAGDRKNHNNVYFYGDTATMIPALSTMAQVWSWLDNNTPAGTIAIPHHPARNTGVSIWTDWNTYNPKYQKVVEMISFHGNSEYSGAPYNRYCNYIGHYVHDAWSRGHKLGVIAGSDHHSGRMGLPGPESGGVFSFMGLAAVRTNELSRAGLLDAITSRNTYGATNAQRIILEFTLNGYRMGEIAGIGNVQRDFVIEVAGTANISTIELFKNNTVIRTWNGTGWHERVTYTATGSSAADYYYVRVIQNDAWGNMAWSSPIWTGPVMPIADAGDDAVGCEGEQYILNGTGSTNVTTYAWTQTAGKTVTLLGADTATPSFVVPKVVSKAEAQLRFRLTGSNANGSDTDDVDIRVRIMGDANGDDRVDSADRRIWLLNYDPLGSNPANSWDTGDFNGDGRIDSADRRLWLLNYNPMGLPD